MRWAFAFVTFLAACGSAPPKPAELEKLQAVRAEARAEVAAKKYPDLVAESDKHMKKSESEWREGKTDDARHWALMGWVALQTALAKHEEDLERERGKKAESELAKLQPELSQLQKDLAGLNEQVALLEKLKATKEQAAGAQKDAAAQQEQLANQLTKEQQKSAAQNKLAAAELALKNSETVNAQKHAAAEYRAAADGIQRARAEIEGGNYAAAETSADMAAKKAEAAEAKARPVYQNEEQAKERKTRDEALGREAAAIAGVTVRLERQGEVARLVLSMGGLFAPKKTNITPGKESNLDPIAALLKKYPSYPVLIVGHTDSKGKRDALLATSVARAQAVFQALVARGAEARRFVVSGQGPDQPIGDNKSKAGRDQNNRVEIVFLYQ
jgi:outer membrane protein OmpA-like peptidoglycan-associated protein